MVLSGDTKLHRKDVLDRWQGFKPYGQGPCGTIVLGQYIGGIGRRILVAHQIEQRLHGLGRTVLEVEGIEIEPRVWQRNE